VVTVLGEDDTDTYTIVAENGYRTQGVPFSALATVHYAPQGW
jgi:hypothetical protein